MPDVMPEPLVMTDAMPDVMPEQLVMPEPRTMPDAMLVRTPCTVLVSGLGPQCMSVCHSAYNLL